MFNLKRGGEQQLTLEGFLFHIIRKKLKILNIGIGFDLFDLSIGSVALQSSLVVAYC